MFLLDLLVSLVIGLILTAIFVALFDVTGPWGSFWVFLLIVVFGAWIGGLWFRPFGPALFGVTWVPFLLMGLLFAILLAAAVPVAPAPPPPPPATPAEARAEVRAEEAAATAFGLFFWILLVGFIIFVVLGYVIAI
jgi:hypothetical protein